MLLVKRFLLYAIVQRLIRIVAQQRNSANKAISRFA
jgi:hypothetical protein